MKRVFLPLFCCIAVTTYAQQEYKGIIHTNNHSPASFVDVVILNEEKVVDEISTDEQGQFSTILEDGTYTIKIEEAGIVLFSQPLIISNGKEIGVIVLPEKENVNLKETVITGQKKMIEKKVDRLIFNPDQAEGAKGGNALDALKLAPRVKVDESTNAISIVGKGTVMVMIDDRMMQMDATQLSNYLKTIRTEDIEKIEIITNPPAKYEASGNSGIINIVTKRGKSDSLNGNINTSASYQKKAGYDVSGSLNYRKGNWTLVTNLYHGDGNWYNEYNSEVKYPGSNWKTNGFNSNENKYYGGKIGIDYQVNEKIITGFTLNTSKGNGVYEGDSRVDIFNQPSNTLNRYITNNADGTNWDWKYIGFNYHVINKINKEGKKLTFDFDYSFNDNTNISQNESNEFNGSNIALPNRYQTNINDIVSSSNRYNVSIDMEHPINSWKMNYGTRLRWAQDDSDNKRFVKTTGDFAQDFANSNQFKYNENIYALYYSVEKQFSEKWTAKAGLRYEHANTKGDFITQNSKFEKNYNGIFPTAYLMYQPSDNHSISINYSRRIDRPFIWYLNPNTEKLNDYSYSQGNPDLKPSYSNNFELEYSYKDLSVTSIYYRNSNDIMEQVQIFDPATQISTSKPFNIGKSYSIGLSENINVKPLKWWKINASADIFYRKTTGGIPELNYVLDGFNGEFRLTNNFELNKSKTFFANYTFSYYTKSSETVTEYSDFMRSNAGLRYLAFNKKLQFSFNVSNLFKNDNPISTDKSNNIISISQGKAFQSFRFGITYSFGKQFSIESSKSNQEQGGGSGGKG